MIPDPRHYRDEGDLLAMCELLQAGRHADNGTYYVHLGDIQWWLYYPPFGVNLFEHLYVWEDPSAQGQLSGWVLLNHDGYNTFDVFIQPSLRGSPLAVEMFDWAEQRLTRLLRLHGSNVIRVMWVFEDDKVLDDVLSQRGYRTVDADVHMVCNLDEFANVTSIPEGWVVRPCRGIGEVDARAAAQHGAFGSSAPMHQYVDRFKRFMQSGVYKSEWDIVAVSDESRIGAFCIVWPDLLNRTALFEPVGTHPDFLRMGLGKAVLLEALRRLRNIGMQNAIVSTSAENHPAMKLYESAGFHINNRLMTYQKNLIYEEI